jgi:branched-chain amino acid transport system ATP-binding protein
MSSSRSAGAVIGARTGSSIWIVTDTFQLTALFPQMTVRENARLAAQAREHRRWQFYGGGDVFSAAGRRADMALERLGLSAVADRPAGLSPGQNKAVVRIVKTAAGPAPGCSAGSK